MADQGEAFQFKVESIDSQSQARTGRAYTPHGSYETPVFMAVGTQGVVKTMAPSHLKEAGSTIILGNTYHLSVRPGEKVIANMGGLHRFMAWDMPVLTDSGGFQVFSLADLCRISDEGVSFRSHIAGDLLFFSPEIVIAIQELLGADIIMPLDHCIGWPCNFSDAREATSRSVLWARRSLTAKQRRDQALFGIVQGGAYPTLRQWCASSLVDFNLPGYAIGGLSVGEPKEVMQEILLTTIAILPVEKPRYLMGVGTPEDLLMAISLGVDMFDCVLPTRNARRGGAFTSSGKIQIRNACHKESPLPLEPDCSCYCCRTFTRSYLHHLFTKKVEEILGLAMLTLHNITFYNRLMLTVRTAIREGRFQEFTREFLEKYCQHERKLSIRSIG